MGLPIPTAGVHASQYHAQNELGEASFGYSHPGQSSQTYQDPHGNQIGSYSYVDSMGKLNKVDYVADALGFRVVANNLPVGPLPAGALLSRGKRQALIGGPLGMIGAGPIGMIGAHPIVRSDIAISAPLTRDATLTQIVHNPGHAMSYRVD